MAQWINELPAKPDSLSSSSRTHVIEKKIWLSKVVLWHSHVHVGKCASECKMNKQINKHIEFYHILPFNELSIGLLSFTNWYEIYFTGPTHHFIFICILKDFLIPFIVLTSLFFSLSCGNIDLYLFTQHVFYF